jgi:hypothetical protein
MRYLPTMRLAMLLALCALASCATSREACLRAATAELATLDRLIAETEANLARGYAIAREPYTTTTLEFCVGTGRLGGAFDVGLRYCPDVETRYRDRPVAIDPAAERRKLAQLRARRAAEAERAAARQAACPPA